MLETAGLTAVLQVRVPRPLNSDAVPFPERVLVVVVRRATLELWRILRQGSGEPIEQPPRALGALPHSMSERVALLLERQCAPPASCSSLALMIAPDADFHTAALALQLLAKTIGESPRAVVFDGRLAPPREAPMFRVVSQPPTYHSAAMLVRQYVRANYAKFRRCYEGGVQRDPKLAGTLVSRLVIGVEGSVTAVFQGPESTMTDEAVVSCVLREYRNMVFPKPDAGIVVVDVPVKFGRK